MTARPCISSTPANSAACACGPAKANPAPASDPSRCKPEAVQSVLSGLSTRRPIKTVLLDQTILAGIGNIYADESLFAAGIHPLTPACPAHGRAAAALEPLRAESAEGRHRPPRHHPARLPHRGRPQRGKPGPSQCLRPLRPAVFRLRRMDRKNTHFRPLGPLLPLLPEAAKIKIKNSPRFIANKSFRLTFMYKIDF